MASPIHVSISKCIFFCLFVNMSVISATIENYDYIKTGSLKSFGLKKEKLTHFRVYWQDLRSGPHPTSILVVNPPKKSGFFGMVNMIDNALTAGPDLNSKLEGRAQGFYAASSQGGEPAALMVMNFVFIEGKYSGSTISVLGRNSVLSKVREMPVIGGSGLFRFARGYVEARTHMLNMTSGDASVEYNCYVLHY